MSLPKCRIGKFYTVWAWIGGDEGDASRIFQPEGDSIGNVPPLYQFIKTNLQAYSETNHSTILEPYIGVVVKLIYEFSYKLPITQ